jgi:hypothetical protein
VRSAAIGASLARQTAADSSEGCHEVGPESGYPLSQPLRAELEAIQERWRRFCRNGHLPRRADFPPESLTPWMGHIQIIEIVPDGDMVRYRWRLVGTRIVYYEGRDNTGRFLDDVIPEDQRSEVLRAYQTSMETRAPVYGSFYSCSDAAISSQLERLILPLATDGKTVDQFLVAIYRLGS